MSGIGFELHRLLRTERRQHRAAAARQSHNRASTQWLPPIAMLGSAGVLTMLTLGRSDHLEHVTGLFIALVTVSLLACAIPTAAIARIASDPQAPLVRPLVIANLSATALAMLCLLLLWPTLARVFDLSVSQPAAMSATLLANVWPPVVALLLRRQARHAALPVALGAIMLLAVWLVLQRSVQIDPPHSIDLLFYLGLVATVYGIVLGLSFRLDDNARSQPGTPSSSRLDYTTWASTLFTVMILGDRVLLSHADQPAASMLHAAAPALIATLCVAPALWYLVKWLEPSLCHYRAELMRAVYEGESLEHIEQQLSTFTTESVLGLNTLAKILGVTAIAGFLIGPDLLAMLELDPAAIVPLQLAIISSAMLAQFLGCTAILWLMQLQAQAFFATAGGVLLYTIVALPAVQGSLIQPAFAAALAACMTGLLTFATLRHSLDTLSVDMLLD